MGDLDIKAFEWLCYTESIKGAFVRNLTSSGAATGHCIVDCNSSTERIRQNFALRKLV